MTPASVRLTGWGSYAPETVLTNADLERLVDTSDEWIVARTGIRQRHVAAPHETTATLAAIAGKRAIAVAGLEPDDIDLILIATLTPDYWMPSTAALVKEAIGNTRAAAFDVMAACSGFVYAYATAHRSRGAYQWSVETSVYVAPGHHRQGLGATLYDALLPRLAGRGYCHAYAGITLPNDASVALHRRVGFQAVGVFRSVGWKLGAWHDVSWWHLPLRAGPPGDRPGA